MGNAILIGDAPPTTFYLTRFAGCNKIPSTARGKYRAALHIHSTRTGRADTKRLAWCFSMTGTNRAHRTKILLAQLIGRRLRDLRTAQRLTQGDLAGEDLTKSAISQFEKGVTMPSLETLVYLAERLGVHPSYFLEDVPHLRSDLRAMAENRGVDPTRLADLLDDVARHLR